MTCKEKLIADHPDWTEERIVNYIKNNCPSDCGYLEDPTDEDGDLNCYTHCSKCWDREIPGTEVKKENEEMNCKCEVVDMIKQLQFDKDALMKECDELKKKLDEKSRLVDIYGARLDTKDVMLKKLNETNEDLANKLAEERARVDDKTHELSLYKRELENRDNHINELYARNNNLKEQIKNLRAEKDAMAAGKAKALDEKDRIIESRIEAINKLRIEVDNLRAEKETQAESIKDLLESNDKMKENMEAKDKEIDVLTVRVKNQVGSIKYLNDRIQRLNDLIDAKNKRIQELCARIDKMNEDIKRKEEALDTQNDVINMLHDKVKNLEKRDEFKTVLPGMDVASLYPTGMYIEPDIEATYRIAEKLNACGNSYIVSANELCHAIARTMYNKYDALVKAGFSHDDAMSLIPMWTD